MRLVTLALLLALAHPANAQSFALASAAEVVHGTQPRIFDRTMQKDFALALALRSFDAAQSCWHLANGARETSIPSQNCGFIIGWSFASAGVGLASAYELSKHGHRKLARIAQYAIASPALYESIKSFNN